MTDEQIEKEVLDVVFGNAGLKAPEDGTIKVQVHRDDPPYEPAQIISTIVLSDGSICFLKSRVPAFELGYDAFLWTRTST